VVRGVPSRRARRSLRRASTSDASISSIPINACGGIFSAADARACLDAGAATVQVYTGLIYEGPAVAGRILAGLGAR